MLPSAPSLVCNAVRRTPPMNQCPEHAFFGALLHSRPSTETLPCINEGQSVPSAYAPNIPTDGLK